MKKAIRIIGIILVTVVLFATIIISMMPKASEPEDIWDNTTTMGNTNAKNHYIIYSDLACPYCIIFENALLSHEEEYQEYINRNNILVEVRISDFLYEYGTHPSPASRLGAIATYCAKNEGKFWDYYNLAIKTIANDYDHYGIGSTNPTAGSTTDEYWLKLGKQVGLGDDFESCYKNKTPLGEIIATARKTVDLVDGMPFFKFNNYTFSGFNPNGTWEDAKMHLDAGLKKK